MKKLTSLCLFIALLFIGFSCKNVAENKDQSQTENQVADTSKQVKKELTAKYQCPMKCEGEKTYAEAGKCPECDMDLAKVE